MAEAVSETASWIQVESMSNWHVKWGLYAIENSAEGKYFYGLFVN
jgi:hypothetical protein